MKQPWNGIAGPIAADIQRHMRQVAGPQRVMEFAEAIRRWTRQDDGPGKEPGPVVLARFDDLPEDYRLSIWVKVTKIEQLHKRKARRVHIT